MLLNHINGDVALRRARHRQFGRRLRDIGDAVERRRHDGYLRRILQEFVRVVLLTLHRLSMLVPRLL